MHKDDRRFFIVMFIVILAWIIMTASVMWALLSYGGKWDDCRVNGGEFKVFSGECHYDENEGP